MTSLFLFTHTHTPGAAQRGVRPSCQFSNCRCSNFELHQTWLSNLNASHPFTAALQPIVPSHRCPPVIAKTGCLSSPWQTTVCSSCSAFGLVGHLLCRPTQPTQREEVQLPVMLSIQFWYSVKRCLYFKGVLKPCWLEPFEDLCPIGLPRAECYAQCEQSHVSMCSFSYNGWWLHPN